MSHKFDPKKLAKLDSPERRKLLPPEQVVEKLEVRPGEVWADVGCGIGYISIPLAQALTEQGKVYGLDISPEMLEVACQRTEQAKVEQIDYRLTPEDKLALPNGSCDGVVLVNVWHEVEGRSGYLTELKRILRPGGKLCIVDWQKVEMQMGPPLDHRIAADEVKAELGAQDFEQISMQSLGSGHYIVSGIMVI